ncbi:GH92 family glycosyl hydrolase [Kribbella sp. NBC_01245]|uniref:GH92 family glycosyl hydrolase n=1 Tax=Kribbella sp. NBC_01245 TaxID=2903578 RepID=UPI002E2BAC8C|nr:GH92 family glycosyl hydrolase [Kribbella sp. NBC_01245]
MKGSLFAVRRRAQAVLAGSLVLAIALAAPAAGVPSPGVPSTVDRDQPTHQLERGAQLDVPSRITTSSADPVEHVDPLIGTTNAGNVFPGAVVPFGMFSFSPENSRGNQFRTAAPAGYLYTATKIRGFSLTHMSGTGCAGGSGDIPIFPHAGTVESSPQTDNTDSVYASKFSHANEIAKPGYYKVGLDSGVTAELGATARTGSARFAFPADKPSSVLFRVANSEVGSSDAEVRVDPATRTVSGTVTSGNFCGYLATVGQRSYYKLHFVAQFDQPFSNHGTWTNNVVQPSGLVARGGSTYGTNGWMPAGKGSGAYLGFDAKTVNMRVGISYVSTANAKANLNAENPAGTTLESVTAKAKQAWHKQLKRVEITGGTTDERTTFYTALYHALLHPNLFSDVNGQYWGFDQQAHRVSKGQTAQYATFSGWDVYRSQVQLLAFLEPKIAGDVAQSLLNQANQNGGVWDRWTHASGSTAVMTGDPSAPALAGIHAFGGTNFDVKASLKSLVKAATVPTAKDLSSAGKPVMSIGQRPSLDKYLALHYIPTKSNAWGGAVETLEDVTADFAIAELARRTGDRATYDKFLKRSQYWQNVFNPGAGGYIQNRDENGAWPAFVPETGDGFAEGSSAQYTWMIPHNRAGLFDAMGGVDAANKRLDAFFRNPDGSWALTRAGALHAEMDNEPSINVPWTYNYSGQPYKTQETLRESMKQLWNAGTGGIPGNDDLGAMSSWYVWTALGLYPQVPSRAELLVAGPLFPSAVVHRDNGRTVRINAPGATTDTPYVQSLKVNGKTTSKTYLPESFVTNGGTLDFKIGATANTSWGSKPNDAPPSWRTGELPYQTSTSTSRIVVAPGTTSTEPVVIKAHRLSGKASTVSYTVTTPAGLIAKPASGSFAVDQTGSASVSIEVAPGTPDGRYDVSVALTAADGTALPRLGFSVVVGEPNTMAVLRDGVGISDDAGDHEEADYDGGGVSYSRQALAAAGLTGGGTTTQQGLTFTWPGVPAGDPDNVAMNGQLLNLDVPATATKLAFVGSAVNGNQEDKATLKYADGTTEEVDLSFSDWTLGGGGDTVHFGNLVIATTPYRNQSGGGKDNVATHIFATKPFDFPAGKRPVSVTLPGNTSLRLFTVAYS